VIARALSTKAGGENFARASSLQFRPSGARLRLAARASIASANPTPLIASTQPEEIGAGSISCNLQLFNCPKKL
jgi:hypothetical protein